LDVAIGGDIGAGENENRIHGEAATVKLEAELCQWYNTMPDSLHFSNFLGTLYLTTH
jgi:hypothetical protein